MQIKILTIDEAWELYLFIKDIYPESASTEILAKVLKDIMKNIVIRNPDDVFKLFNLLIDFGNNKIEDVDRSIILSLVLESFIKNSIHELVVFFKEVTGSW